MASTNINIISPEPTPDTMSSFPDIVDYSEILDSYGIPYIKIEYYLSVGHAHETKGWALDISVIKSQIPTLLATILPTLIERNAPFKIVQDSSVAEFQLEGSTGYAELGKIISVFPPNDRDTLEMAKQLISLTHSFRGPAIPTSRHLGAVVYARYENAVDQKHLSETKSEGERLPIWPFDELAPALKPKQNKLLNNFYYPISMLKPDAKGDVIKALYFKHFWRIKPCLIKQGRKHSFVDEIGRDMRTRIQWQYDIYKQLKNDVRLPKVLDLFSKDEDLYLCTEFINGSTLTQWISDLYQDRFWQDLPIETRIVILTCLLSVMTIVRQFHDNGYIHRDISPENFLIDKRGNIYPIDLELAWCSKTGLPDPPFNLGTPGFISPEKYKGETPTVAEDLYSFGAFMTVFFTNLTPLKLSPDPDKLERVLLFFLADAKLSHGIAACLQNDPAKRPSLSTLKTLVTRYQSALSIPQANISHLPSEQTPDPKRLAQTIQAAVNGLSASSLLSPSGRWISIEPKQTKQWNEQLTTNTFFGWQVGMCGPMWVLAKAKAAGFKITSCQEIYENCFAHIRSSYFNTSPVNMGLHGGAAGVALTLAEGLQNGLLVPDHEISSLLEECFAFTSTILNLSSGVAGQGLSLLRSERWLNRPFRINVLTNCVRIVLERQRKDGAWDLFSGSAKQRDIAIGLYEGVAGVVWFLLAYLEQQPDEKVTQSCLRALNWIIRNGHQSKGVYSWKVSTKSNIVSSWSVGYGTPGIILVFIKAYQVLKHPIFKSIAETTMFGLPDRPVIPELGLSVGLSGLGNMYLNAHSTFNRPLWKERAHWIVNVLEQTVQRPNNNISFWVTTDSSIITADLSAGMSGVIHFLIRMHSR